MKKIITLLAIALSFNSFSIAQNLIPNPGFDDYFMTFCGIMTSSDFDDTVMDWKNPTQASPGVYFTNIDQSCYNFQPDSQYPGPIGLKGSQLPRSGEVMAGIWVYTIPDFNQRQYLQVQLSAPMIQGNAYIVSFYVSLGDYMESAVSNLGAYLSVNPVSANGDGPLILTPQVTADEFITDVTEWVLISDTIVAADNYAYLTIGNFFDDNATATMSNPGSTGEPGTYGAYYFVDDVSVEETIISSTAKPVPGNVDIFPNPFQNELGIVLPVSAQEAFVTIYNLQGVAVFELRSAGEPVLKIDSSALPAGAYFATVQIDGRRFTRKVVKF
jgi:hypothetical protein